MEKTALRPLTPDRIGSAVRDALAGTRVVDIHTHLFDPALGPLLLWGIDELLTYHYLVAEVFRARPDLAYETFWAMDKTRQADLIWTELFRKRSPISEACRGVLTVLQKLGLDANVDQLKSIRGFFRGQTVTGYVDRVFALAGVDRVYMTNDPLDPQEALAWQRGVQRDPRFLAALRLDSSLIGWPAGVRLLKAAGYPVTKAPTKQTMAAVRRYLNDWCDRMDARYMAISLPPSFRYPDPDSATTQLMAQAVIPTARDRGIPVAMMLGVKKLVNPALRLAGDSVGKCDIGTLERIAADHADVRFLITMLSRENMHELCITARKFANITPFGCWWFLNNPSLIEEITAMRVETLGLSFIPQHSDARILDQLVYKWTHSRAVIGDVLARKYADLTATGWHVTPDAIRRDVRLLFAGAV